jgi:hypothetical protein
MRKYIKTTLFLITTIIISSCEKKVSEMDFEKSVMTEIFPSLVDSICVDCRKMDPPPQFGEDVYDKSGHFVREDSTKATKATKEQIIEYRKWQREREEIEKDTSKLIVAFVPILKKIRGKVKEDFEKHFPKIKLYEPKEEKDTEYIFDFKNIKLNNKFEFKNFFEFPKERGAIWETKYNFVFSGVLDFSRIQFDKDKKFGVLDAGFGCGSLCGQGFRIYIKKAENKWVIDKIEGTWIS